MKTNLIFAAAVTLMMLSGCTGDKETNVQTSEAVGYADLVLNVRPCLEAMFAKGRALYRLERFEEAMAMHELIVTKSKKGEGIAIDKKEYLFEAQLNKALGRPNFKTCKHLLKICPELRGKKKKQVNFFG